MKTLLLAAALLLPLTAVAAEPAKPAKAADVKAANARLTIPVGGMTCGGCVENVSSSLKKVDGVKAVEVNLEEKRAVVTFDGAKVTAKQLTDAITAAGYEPGVPAAN